MTDDDEIDHIYCCDENVALCGADLSDFELVADNDDDICPQCAYLEGQACDNPYCTINCRYDFCANCGEPVASWDAGFSWIHNLSDSVYCDLVATPLGTAEEDLPD